MYVNDHYQDILNESTCFNTPKDTTEQATAKSVSVVVDAEKIHGLV